MLGGGENGLPSFHKSLTCLAVVKTDSPKFYKPPTHLAVVTMDSPNLDKPPTWSKLTHRICTMLQHDLR